VEMVDIRKKAKDMGVKVSGMKKADLIRSIQVAEDNIPFFGTEKAQYYGEEGCHRREDCLPKNKQE
jgi:hypothetical protein